MPDPAVDPSVITPIVPSSAGSSSNTSPSTVPMTFDPPVMTQQTEVPNYLTGSPPAVSATPTPMPAASQPPVPGATTPTSPEPPVPQAPLPQYPSIQVMSEELKSSGVLLSDIEVKQMPDTSPLAHLQPDNLVSGANGPEPAFVVKNQAPIPIPLANAGIPSISPSLAATTPGASRTSINPDQRPPASGLVKVVIGMVIVFLILIVGYLAWQYFTAGAMARYDDAPTVFK